MNNIEVLNKKKEIDEIFKKGKSFHTKNFVLLILVKRELKSTSMRYAIITSKKIGKAFQRNRARRIIRAALRGGAVEKLQTPCDLIIIAKKNIVGKKMQDIEIDLAHILKTKIKRGDNHPSLI